MIVLRDLRKIYAGSSIPAVDGISLQVEKGEVFGLLGPNGAGKTTTVKMLVGLLRPTSGQVEIFHRPPQDREVKQRLGFLPEQPYFYQYLSAREFLTMCAEIFRMPSSEIEKKIETVLQRVHLEPEVWNQAIRTYSKGMQQGLGLAQALINDPELVILDEPMSGLDPLGRKEVKDLILDLRREGKTVFFNSHILADVETLCDRVAILDHGHIVCEGTVADLTKKGVFSLEEVFLKTITALRK